MRTRNAKWCVKKESINTSGSCIILARCCVCLARGSAGSGPCASAPIAAKRSVHPELPIQLALHPTNRSRRLQCLGKPDPKSYAMPAMSGWGLCREEAVGGGPVEPEHSKRPLPRGTCGVGPAREGVRNSLHRTHLRVRRVCPVLLPPDSAIWKDEYGPRETAWTRREGQRDWLRFSGRWEEQARGRSPLLEAGHAVRRYQKTETCSRRKQKGGAGPRSNLPPTGR